jgi:hypothetical protein
MTLDAVLATIGDVIRAAVVVGLAATGILTVRWVVEIVAEHVRPRR